MVESLLGLLIFSLMLTLYLPAYLQEVQAMKEAVIVSDQWRLFYEMTLMELDSSLNDQEKGELLTWMDESPSEHLQIHYFACNQYHCQIIYEDGSEFIIDLEVLEGL